MIEQGVDSIDRDTVCYSLGHSRDELDLDAYLDLLRCSRLRRSNHVTHESSLCNLWILNGSRILQ